MTMNRMHHLGTGRHMGERKELTRKQRVRIMGRKETGILLSIDSINWE
jgi:hypothetical protein